MNLVRRSAPRLPAAVWLALLLAHALVLAYALHSGRTAFPDTDRYVQAAYNLGHYGRLYARPLPAGPVPLIDVQEYTIRPPGYPLLVLALGAAGGRVWPLLLLQNALSCLLLASVLRGWAATRPRPPGPGAWALAVALALSFPAQLIYASAVMAELPVQAALWLGVGLAARACASGRPGWLAGAAGALVAGFLLKPVLYPLVGPFALLAGGLAWHRRRPVLLAWGLLPLALAAAYCLWNEQRTGYRHFSSISTINLLNYNAAGVVRLAEGPAAENRYTTRVQQAADAQPTFTDRQRTMEAGARAALRRYPGRYAFQHLLGMGTMLLDPGRFDLVHLLGTTRAPGLLDALRERGWWGALARTAQQPPWLLLLLAAVAAANAARLLLAARGLGRGLATGVAAAPARADWLLLDTRAGRWLTLALLLYLLLLTGPLGAARFLVPGYPLLLALALRGVKS